MPSPKLSTVAAKRFCLQITLIFFLISRAVAQPWSAADKKVRDRYYRLLDSVATAAPEKQVSALRRFAVAYPQIERVFPKLLECYQVQTKIAEAKDCFQKLAWQPSSRRNSLWILAKIAVFENDDSTAENFFSQALHDKMIAPSPALLNDYIEFRYQQSGQLAAPTILRDLALSPDNRAIAAAFVHYQNEEYDQASAAFRQASQNALDDGVVLHVWGDGFLQNERKKWVERLAGADSLWRRGLELAKRSGDLEMQAHFLTNLGDLAYERGVDVEAAGFYDSASAIARRLDHVNHLQRILGKQGNICVAQSDREQAEALYQTALGTAVLIGADRDRINHYLSYGQLLYELGRHEQAFQAYNEGEKLAQKLRNVKKQIYFMIKKGRLFEGIEAREMAKEILQQAYHWAVLRGYIDLSLRAKVALADFLNDSENEEVYNEARAAYFDFIKHLELTGKQAISHNYLAKIADTYKAEEAYGKAKEYYWRANREAGKFGEKFFQAWYLYEIANVEVRQENFTEALKTYDRVIEIATTESYADLLGHAYSGSGEAQQRRGDYENAVSDYHRAAAIFEAARQDQTGDPLLSGYFSNIANIYGKLAECFAYFCTANDRRADLDSIFHYAQMSKSRALFELRNRASLPAANARDDLAMQKYQRACEQLRSIQRRLRQHPNEYAKWREQLQMARYSVATQALRLKNHDRSAKAINALALSWPVIKTILKQTNLGLLVYHTSEAVPFLLVASGDTAKVVLLDITQLEAASLIDTLLEPFHTVKPQAVQDVPYHAAVAHELYRFLIEPAQKALKLPKRILIVPDLVLTNLPFEMLLTIAPDKPVYTPRDSPAYAGGFLLNQHTIFYSPAIGLIEENADMAKMAPNVLIFANPFDHATSPAQPLYYRRGWSFDALPFSESEAEQIKTIHPPADVRTRKHATESTFLQEAAQQRILHIASHAFVDTSLDAFSGIVLATGSDSTDDGMLMGFEIADLKLNCDLVTLSACETGQGQLTEGESVLGLSRLFLGAGAKSVLLTLWQVHDEFAAELMPKFYEQFLRGKLSKAEALAKTKAAMLNSEKPRQEIYYQHPFYWAPFVLYGDPGINRGLSTKEKFIVAITAFFILALPVIGVYYLRYRRSRM